MSKLNWTVWLIALGAWGLYSCWHIGYQSGYADGHETAWQMYQTTAPIYQVARQRDPSINRDLDDRSELEFAR